MYTAVAFLHHLAVDALELDVAVERKEVSGTERDEERSLRREKVEGLTRQEWRSGG